MYECGVDEQLICERTGHRSVAVRSYKRTSSDQLKNVSNMLYGNLTSNRDVTSTVSKAEDVKELAKVPKIESKVEPITSETSPENVQVEVNKISNQGCESHSIELSRGVVLNINVNFPK